MVSCSVHITSPPQSSTKSILVPAIKPPRVHRLLLFWILTFRNWINKAHWKPVLMWHLVLLRSFCSKSPIPSYPAAVLLPTVSQLQALCVISIPNIPLPNKNPGKKFTWDFSCASCFSQNTETLGLLLISCCGTDKDKNPKYTSDFKLTVELKSSQHLDSVKSTVVAGFEPISGNMGSEKLKTLLSSCLPI